jgi:hypothetical protein
MQHHQKSSIMKTLFGNQDNPKQHAHRHLNSQIPQQNKAQAAVLEKVVTKQLHTL